MALPNGYSVPKSEDKKSRYFSKFEKGKNRFRILSDIITGWEWWEGEEGSRKPERVRTFEEVPQDAWADNERPKHFWAFAGLDYADKEVKLFTITQRTVQDQLVALENDEDWGDLKDYDVTVIRAGEKLETTYSVTPHPKKPIDEKLQDTGINLEALYDGEDPFSDGETIETDELLDALDN